MRSSWTTHRRRSRSQDTKNLDVTTERNGSSQAAFKRRHTRGIQEWEFDPEGSTSIRQPQAASSIDSKAMV